MCVYLYGNVCVVSSNRYKKDKRKLFLVISSKILFWSCEYTFLHGFHNDFISLKWHQHFLESFSYYLSHTSKYNYQNWCVSYLAYYYPSEQNHVNIMK